MPIIFAWKADAKGYSYYAFGIIGFVAPLLAAVVVLLLPDKRVKSALESRVEELECEVERLKRENGNSESGLVSKRRVRAMREEA